MRRASLQGFWVVTGTSMVVTVGVLQVFLLGALGVFVREDLGLTEAQLGMAVAVYFASAAMCAVPVGRLLERPEMRKALPLAAVTSAAALLGLATARSWTQLLGWLVLGGAANSLSQLSANRRLAGAVPRHRQGLAFGIKQGAVPASTLIAGIAVSVLGVTLGWRWVYVSATALALLVGIWQRQAIGIRAERSAHGVPRVPLPHAALTVLAIAGALGAAGATAMATFLVEYAVAVEVPPALAGLILAIGSVTAVVTRVTMGWLADRRRRGNLIVVSAMLLLGAAALASLPTVASPLLMGGAAVVAYAIGWGWPGLFTLAVVRRNPAAPAAASGITQTGLYSGGVLGPLTFGLVVTATGYGAAWYLTASALTTSALLMMLGRWLAWRHWSPA